jgi:hypothetical protein
MNDIFDQIATLIEEKHQEAVRALAVIRQYAAAKPITQMPNVVNAASNQPTIQHFAGFDGAHEQPSIRDRVLVHIRKDFASVERLVELTGLGVRQVRGVVNAPRLQGRFDKRTVRGQVEYRYKGDGENQVSDEDGEESQAG